MAARPKTKGQQAEFKLAAIEDLGLDPVWLRNGEKKVSAVLLLKATIQGFDRAALLRDCAKTIDAHANEVEEEARKARAAVHEEVPASEPPMGAVSG